MFKTENNNIWLTRGDTAEFRPIIEDYEIQDGDEVIFSAKKVINDEQPAIKMVMAAGDSVVFTKDTTINLPSGTYHYDLTLKTVDGDISTFVSGRLIILGEVNHESN